MELSIGFSSYHCVLMLLQTGPPEKVSSAVAAVCGLAKTQEGRLLTIKSCSVKLN